MNYQQIYDRLKRFLATKAGLTVEHITADLRLDAHLLHYTLAGKRSLARPLNCLFSDPPIKRPPPVTRLEKLRLFDL